MYTHCVETLSVKIVYNKKADLMVCSWWLSDSAAYPLNTM